MLFKLLFLHYNVLCSHYADILNKVPPKSPLRLTLLNYKTQQNKTLKGLEQFRKHTPILSNVLSFAPRLFLRTQHGLRFVAFNNLPFLATTPLRHIFFSAFLSLPLTLFVPPCFYLLTAARRSEAYAAEAAAANFFQLLDALILPFSSQLNHYIAVSLTGRCCVAVESIAEGIPAQRLACQSGLCSGKGGEAA